MEPEAADFYIEQALGGGWERTNGGATRFWHEETGSYLRVDHETATYEGKVHRPHRLKAGGLDTAVQTLEDEGYTGTLSSL